MPDESSLHPPNEELEQRAKLFGERARQLLEELHEEEAHATTGGNITFKSIAALHNFLQSQSCYAELNRRRAIERADRDKQEAENRGNRDRDRENRHFWIEIIVVAVLIAAELGVSIYYGRLGIREGKGQAALLHQMNKNTADTALQIQRAADATTASLEILREERAEREKKPRLALYVGNLPIDKATVRLAPRAGNAQDMASFDLVVRNEGEAPANPFQVHVLVPEGVNFSLSPLQPVQEYEEPSLPASRTVSYEVPLMPLGKSLRIHAEIWAVKGRASFKAAFTITTAQLQAVTSLGSLTILPAKP